jgi:hypothetical protein
MMNAELQIPCRRQHERFETNFPVKIYVNEQEYYASVINISQNGAFVSGIIPLHIGDEIVIETPYMPFLLNCKVRWARGSSEAGFGIEFISKLPSAVFDWLTQVKNFSQEMGFKNLSNKSGKRHLLLLKRK